ncbi:MAG: NAD(P)-dependent oxidoreductase [Orrella sp.]
MDKQVKPRVGLIGVGMMGHGIALNLLKHSYPLCFLQHEGNQPTQDLIEAGGQSTDDVRVLAERTDMILLCVTGSPQVESVVFENGLLDVLSARHVIIDCSTALPESTIKVSQAIMAQGAGFLDAPMTRTPKEAAEGRLNLIVGGSRPLFEKCEPLLRCFAQNIAYAGDVGAGHRMKLLHNFVSLGFAALLSEAAACASQTGISSEAFVEILANGGGDSVILNRLRPYLEEGSDAGFRFSLANAVKDMGYYQSMAKQTQASDLLAQAVLQTYEAGLAKDAQATVPALIDLLAPSNKSINQ